MNKFSPIPYESLTHKDIEDYKILPVANYFSSFQGIVPEGIGWPFWIVNDSIEIILIRSLNLVLIYKDTTINDVLELMEEGREFDLSDWDVRWINSEYITLRNTKIENPFSLGYHIKFNKGSKYDHWGNETEKKKIIGNIVKNGTYEILYKNNHYDYFDVEVTDCWWSVSVHIGYSLLKQTPSILGGKLLYSCEFLNLIILNKLYPIWNEKIKSL